MNHTYAELLAELFGRSADGVKLGLEATTELLTALGQPQRRFPCVVVAGTNGKGSTSNLVARGLSHAGYRVGLFTSPHLLRFAERIRVDGREFSANQLAELYRQVVAVESQIHRTPTFFECCTAMALLAFAQAAVDVAVLEVGLGGRLDATNVVDKHLAVITPIGWDHQNVLGDTLEAIAGEKAGILPLEGRAIAAPQAPEAQRVLETVAQERSTRLIATAPWTSDTAGLTVRLPERTLRIELSSFLPPYQHMNVATAATALHCLAANGFPRALQAVPEAFLSWQPLGRYQWIPGTPPCLLDGAHNIPGAEALARALDTDTRLHKRSRHLVFSAVRGKDAEPMLSRLGRNAASVHLCPVSSPRARPRDAWNALAAKFPSGMAHVWDSVPEALQQARKRANHDGVVIVAGSLFLVAEALHAWTDAPKDPPIGL